MKRVFFFGNGEAEGAGLGKETLGGKGSGLAEMTALGIPVPPGFTIETGVCADFSHGASLDGVHDEVDSALARLEHLTGRRFGDAEDPLLVSVRSGARSSMPGMMDTILNLGLTSRVEGPGRALGRAVRVRLPAALSRDVLRRRPARPAPRVRAVLAGKKRERGVKTDVELTADDLKDIVEKNEAIVRARTGKDFPDEAREQLWGAIAAVFRSWDNERAQTYRKLHHIPDDWGTAVNVQSMVFGNRGETSATGVAFTRDPSTGERTFYGEFLPNAQGEDVVAGIRTPRPLSKDGSGSSLEETMPEAYRGAAAAARRAREALSRHAGPGVHDRGAQGSTSCRPATGSAPASPPCGSRPRWSTRA